MLALLLGSWSGSGSGARPRRVRWVSSVVTIGFWLWGLLWALNALGVVLPLGLTWILVVLALLCVGPAAAFAFRHEGLLVCLALGSAIPLVLYLVPTVAPSMAPDESVLWGIRSGLTFGLPAGAVGFVVGLGARRLAGARRTGS